MCNKYNFSIFQRQTERLLANYGKVPKNSLMIISVMIISILGTTILKPSEAATPYVSGEPELGQIDMPAQTEQDITASGGQSVKFGIASATINKPADASTGPRTSTVSTGGGTISGNHSGKRFTSQVHIYGAATLTDCVLDGGLFVHAGPVGIDHCDINGWLGVVTDNTDPTKQIFTMRHSKAVGPTDGDAIRIGAYPNFGDNTKYLNTLIEDSILHSPYNTFGAGDQFDHLQFGGGRNSAFKRVVFSYANNPFNSAATNYINNGTGNINVTFEDLWIEGGSVGYTLAGPMNVNRCTINRSTKQYGYIYPAPGTVITNCKDDLGIDIQGT
jgi:hypothetical protein